MLCQSEISNLWYLLINSCLIFLDEFLSNFQPPIQLNIDFHLCVYVMVRFVDNQSQTEIYLG